MKKKKLQDKTKTRSRAARKLTIIKKNMTCESNF